MKSFINVEDIGPLYQAMAEAFELAVRGAELAVAAHPPSVRATASATSPMDIFK